MSVITTNFDHVLKWAFEKAGNPFIEQVTPRRELDMPAIDRIWRQHSLIKLHGSISREEDIVLTKEEYDSVYGESFVTQTPFTRLLKTIYTNNVLLFLGCSLSADRTMEVLKSLIRNEKRDHYHYAFMELPKETENTADPYAPNIYKDGNKNETMVQLERRLSNYRIRVIWFPYHKYEAIDVLLDELCRDLRLKRADKMDLGISSYGVKAVSSYFIKRAVTDKADELNKYIQDFIAVDTGWNTVFPVVCNNLDIPHTAVISRLQELIKSRSKRILLTGNAGCGKSTIMLRTAVELAKKGRNVYWINLEEVNNTQEDYDEIITYIHQCSAPKIPSILFIENPYYGKEELLKLRKAFGGKTKNIQIVMSERVQRFYELTYENNNYFHKWFQDVDIVIMHSQNEGASNYDFFEDVFYTNGDFRLIDILPDKEWLKDVIVNFTKKKLGYIPKDTVNMIIANLDEKELYCYSLVEIQYRLLFEFAELNRKIYSRNNSDYLLDWDEWAKRLVNWNIVKEEDSFEYYQLLATFGLFDIKTELDDYIEFHSLDEKKRQMVQKLNMMVGEYNIEPIRFQPDTNRIAPKHDIACELFFLFNPRWQAPFKILFLYIHKMDAKQLKDLINAVHLNIKGYASFVYGKFNWSELMQTITETPVFAEVNRDVENDIKVVQCMFWGYINEDDFNTAYSYLREKLFDDLYKDNIYLLKDFASLCTTLELFDEAIDILERGVKVDKTHIPSTLALGKLYFYYKKDISESKRLFEYVLSINPKHSVARRYLAKVLDEEKNYEEAEEQYKLALYYKASDYMTLVEYGNHFLALSQYPQAIEKYHESLSVFPNNRPANIALGKMYLQQASYRDAEHYLKKALRFSKLDFDTMYYLSELYIAEGRQQEAIDIYAKKNKVGKNFTKYLSAFGDLYQRLGLYGDAIKKYQEALKITPTNRKVLNGLTEIYIIQNRISQAEELLSNNFMRFPEQSDILKIYIKFLEDTGQHNKISAILNSYVVSDISYKKSLRELKHVDLTVQEEVVLQKKLGNLEDVISLGELYVNLNMLPDAYTLYKNALTRYTDNVSILWELGQVCIVQNNYAEAIELLRKLLELQPDDYKVRVRLAQMYIEENDYEKADMVLFNDSKKKTTAHLTKIRKGSNSKRRFSEHKELYKEEKNQNKSLVDIENVINTYNTTHILSIIKEMFDDKDELIHFMNGLINRNPEKVYIKNILIKYYGSQKMYYEAGNLFKKTLRLHGKPISTFIEYGGLCIESGNLSEAIEIYKEALVYYTDNTYIRTELARLLVLVNEKKEAEKVLDEIVRIKYPRQISCQLMKLYYEYDNKEEGDRLLSEFVAYYKYNCNELIAMFQYCASNGIDIENGYITYLLQNFIFSSSQKESIIKIFEKLYSNLQIMGLYNKIINYDANQRKIINVLQMYYEKFSNIGSKEAIWNYILRVCPKDNDTLLKLEKLYIEQRGLEYALDFMDKFYANNINSAHISHVYYNFLNRYGFEERAEKILCQALDIIPDSQLLLTSFAKLCRNKGEIGQLKNVLYKLINLNPGNANYIHRLANILVGQEEYETARRLCIEFLELYPSEKNSSIRLFLADIYLKDNSFESAHKWITYLVEQKYKTNIPKIMNFTGFIDWEIENIDRNIVSRFIRWLNKNKRIDDVIYAYKMQIKKDEADVDAYYCLGTVYDDLCQFESAVYYLQEGLKFLEPDKRDNANYYHKAASVYRKLSKYDKASYFYHKELELKKSFYGYSGFGLLNIWLGHLEDAEIYLIKAVKLLKSRPSPSVYLNFGILKLYQHKYKDAEKFFKMSLNVSQRYKIEPIKAYYWLAKLHSKLGEETKPVNYLNKIAKERMIEIEDVGKEKFLGSYNITI